MIPAGLIDLLPDARAGLTEVRAAAIPLSSLSGPRSSMLALLDASERERAASFQQAIHRDRFIRRRWFRRQWLALIADVDPAAIRIDHTRLGRPVLVGPSPLETWVLSTSHSEDLCAVAVSPARPIGIDVACRLERHITDEAARTFMHRDEYVEWRRQREAQQASGFFRLWARKEAVLKAIGTGFAIEPARIDVRADSVTIPGEGDVEIHDLDPPQGWSGAIATLTSVAPSRIVSL